jgi:hypothetical protein
VRAFHRVAHQLGDDGAFVLAFKSGVEGIFDVFRDAEIDGGHGASFALLKISTTLCLFVVNSSNPIRVACVS